MAINTMTISTPQFLLLHHYRSFCSLSPLNTFSLHLDSHYAPDSKFGRIEPILRPWRVQLVHFPFLYYLSIFGHSIGSEFSEDNFIAKVKLEPVVSKEQVDEVTAKIIKEARTREIDDGRIFFAQVLSGLLKLGISGVTISDVLGFGAQGESTERQAGKL
ncbi:hypothetical protein MKW94_020959 [Papaver nudicaule]|uniref:Uncharacterized protein n=1 Tax=Papaver nudicaule TaxID=74823 RepID=A0AA41RVI7_PAPNU|nr:hypothetical protein [Papaver nudicaule]